MYKLKREMVWETILETGFYYHQLSLCFRKKSECSYPREYEWIKLNLSNLAGGGNFTALV